MYSVELTAVHRNRLIFGHYTVSELNKCGMMITNGLSTFYKFKLATPMHKATTDGEPKQTIIHKSQSIQSKNHNPHTTMHKPQATIQKPQSTNHNPQATIQNPRYPSHNLQSINHNQRSTRLRSTIRKQQPINHQPQAPKPRSTNHNP